MDPLLIIPIFFGGMIVIVGITMVACIPVFKAQAKRKQERENLRLKLIEEKELQRLNQEKAKMELELEKERYAMAVFCKYCGSKHEPNAKFCSNCGANLK